jgi:iron complex outermembrane receptor protein
MRVPIDYRPHQRGAAAVDYREIMKRTVALIAALVASAATAQQPGDSEASSLDWIQVTASRFADPVQEVPNAITVITGDELRARGGHDLRSALALVGGAFVAPGGDFGPAASVPGLLGLREVDDFLLVVDGIPAGGAFIPHFDTLDLHDIERIEVLRGAAPVYYGTTAFAGTINVIHYPAGQAADAVSASFGSFGSMAVDGATVLSSGAVKQSLAADVSHENISDARAGYDRQHGLYRLSADLASGQFTFDLDAVHQRQRPSSPTPVADNGQLTTLLSPDFNQNPADAVINTNRVRAVLGYHIMLPFGTWNTTLSATHTHVNSVQGYLQDGFADSIVDDAEGFSQRQVIDDIYLDTSITQALSQAFAITYGVNEIFGHARQASSTFPYSLPLDGTGVPLSGAQPMDGSTTLKDARSFVGAFVQSRLKITPDLNVLAGLRLNHIGETQDAGDGMTSLHQSEHATRWSGAFGVDYRVWKDREGDLDDVTLYANTSNTFQPPQIDFGPDAGFDPLLRPETEKSYELGIKADGSDGRWDLDLTAFWVDFGHQALPTLINGTPALVNGGSERFKGVELEGSWRATDALKVAATFSVNDARYNDFNTLIGDSLVQLRGNYLVLSPRLLSALSATYAPPHGWHASLTSNYVGPRYLDIQNTERAGGYFTEDATVGYAFEKFLVLASGYNLTDRRDPALESDLGEGQYYRVKGRWLQLRVTVPLR